MPVCQECTYISTDFALLDDNDKLIWEYLADHGAVLKSIDCPTCKRKLTRRTDGIRWRCQNSYRRGKKKKVCKTSISIRKNTFLGHSHLSVKTICRFVSDYLKTENKKFSFLHNEFSMSSSTTIAWIKFIHEVLVHWAWTNSSKIIGGEQKIVEIEESFFEKREQSLIDAKFVIGGIERESKHIFLTTVKDRKAQTIIAALKQYVMPKTIIVSDCWSVYKAIADCGSDDYEYFTVDRFKKCSEQTQNEFLSLEDLISNVAKFDRKVARFEVYLAEFLFKKSFEHPTERNCAFFSAVGTLYDPLSFTAEQQLSLNYRSDQLKDQGAEDEHTEKYMNFVKDSADDEALVVDIGSSKL